MTDYSNEATPVEPGITVAEVRIRLYMADDGLIYHKTGLHTPEGEDPPALYVLMGSLDLAKDSIKAAYGGGMYLDRDSLQAYFGEDEDADYCLCDEECGCYCTEGNPSDDYECNCDCDEHDDE